MADEHTPEPWGLHGPAANSTIYPGEIQCIGSTKHTEPIALCMDYLMSAQANARRIVACVNACKGLTTELLEDGVEAAVQALISERLQWP